MASNAIKRQRKRRRVDTDGDPEFQVAPMVDVLLVLMLFFMAITSTEVLKKNKNLTLPDAKNAKKPETSKHQIVVNVGWDPGSSSAQFFLDQTPFASASDMTGAIAAAAKADPAAYVLIRADKEVQYSNISDLMSACAAAGIGTVTFAALIGGSDAPQGGAPAAH
jgi:biopolymer transport protein ExbD